MIKDEFIYNFYKEICQNLGSNYKIILEPHRTIREDWIEYDQVKWEVEETMKPLIDELQKNEKLSLEQKIFEVYKYICLNYIYDANVLYFFRKDNSNPNDIKYIPVDWYGRIVDQKWIDNRKKHNRRICYEFSRAFAKTINLLIGDKKNVEAILVGDKENTHYVVGLTGIDYSVILDQDDFNTIKDLTRLKLNLTLKGIHILRDENKIFTNIVNEYNKDKLENLKEIQDAEEKYKIKDPIKYFNESINTLNKYKLDSQGFFEYIRFLIENAGIKIEKIWKIDTRNSAVEKRHERCLYFNYNNDTYLLDSVEKNLQIVNIHNLDNNLFIFKPEENDYKYCGN